MFFQPKDEGESVWRSLGTKEAGIVHARWRGNFRFQPLAPWDVCAAAANERADHIPVLHGIVAPLSGLRVVDLDNVAWRQLPGAAAAPAKPDIVDHMDTALALEDTRVVHLKTFLRKRRIMKVSQQL